MKFHLLVFLPFVALFFSFSLVSGKVVSHHIKSKGEFVYIDKFCYDTSGPGILNATISKAKSSKPLLFLLYDDQRGSWSSVYKKDIPCEEKVNKSREHGYRIETIEKGTPIRIRFDDYVLPHFWYFAVGNCEGEHFELDIQMTMVQHEKGLIHQFSYDEQGLLDVSIVFFVFFLLLSCLKIYADWQFWRVGNYHPICRLFTAAMLLEFFSQMFFMIHYSIYAKNGQGDMGSYVFAQILDYTSLFLFTILVSFIATGWGINQSSVTGSKGELVAFLILILVSFVAYITLFFWEHFGVDPASTTYIYDTSPGIFFLIVRGFFFIFVLWSFLGTMRKSDDRSKKIFFFLFGLGCVMWFLMLPLIALLSLSFDGYYRLKVVTSFHTTTTFLAYSGLLFLLWPTRANRYFEVAMPDVFATYDTL